MTTTYTITTTDPAEAQLALDAHKWQRLVRDLDEEMRQKLKHSDGVWDTDYWRQRIRDLSECEGLHLYE